MVDQTPSAAHDLIAAKRALRHSIRASILATPLETRRLEQAACESRFLELPGFTQARVVCLYVSAFPEELETRPLVRMARSLGKIVVLPRVDRAARRLVLYVVDNLETDLASGAMGIPEPRPDRPMIEPEAVEWLLAPGLGFDDGCHRLGRGAGYYDRLLPRLSPNAPTWALCFESQWVATLPRADHDVPLHGVASASRIIERAGPS